MNIRPVESPDELAAAVQLIYDQVAGMISSNQQPYKDVPRYFPAYRDLMLVAESDGELVGAIIGYGPAERSEEQFSVLVKGLGVREDHRGSGLGRSLLAELERRAAAMGAVETNLGAVPSARGFYARLGYSGKSRMRKSLTGNGISRYGSADQRKERLAKMRARQQVRRAQ